MPDLSVGLSILEMNLRIRLSCRHDFPRGELGCRESRAAARDCVRSCVADIRKIRALHTGTDEPLSASRYKVSKIVERRFEAEIMAATYDEALSLAKVPEYEIGWVEDVAYREEDQSCVYYVRLADVDLEA